MADTDSSSYITRYNFISKALEYFTGADWYQADIDPAAASFTPAVQFTTGPGSNSTSSAFTNTPLTSAFAMATGTHRVKVTITASVGMAAVSDNGLYYTLSVDGVNQGDSVQGLAGIEVGTAIGAEYPTSLVYIYTPGDTASHTYTFQIASGNNTTVIHLAAMKNVMILEEII